MSGAFDFVDRAVFREERFSIGVEARSGRHFLSIPVAGLMVDYEEHYEISQAEFDRFEREPPSALDLIKRCEAGIEHGRLFRLRAVSQPVFEATIAAPVDGAGAGLHTGKRSSVRILPAAAGQGIVFRRLVDGAPHDVAAVWTNRRSRPLCTALQAGDGPLIRTVEHLLAALSALNVDNALIEIDGEEVPIFDGSAEPWRERLAAAGRQEQERPRTYLRVRKRVERRDGVHKHWIEPQPYLSLYAAITLSHFGQLHWEGRVDPDSFGRELAPSRSFGRFKWAVLSKIAGRFGKEPVLRGATLQNTAALWGRNAIGGLRMPDEPVRHRALDVIGDLALAGYPLLGKMTAIRPGHEHNFGLLSALMSDTEAWDLVTLDESGRLHPAASGRAA